MVSSNANIEGGVFDRGASTTATILPAGARGFFYNSRTVNMPVGEVSGGMFVNNSFALNATLSQPAVIVNGGKASTLLEGTSDPVPQLLFGKTFP